MIPNQEGIAKIKKMHRFFQKSQARVDDGLYEGTTTIRA